MLTATYSLVVIVAEQENARSMLGRLQQYVQNIWCSMQSMDFALLDGALSKLRQFDDYCRRRKLELYVIPALRKLTRDADALIAELEAISMSGMNILQSVRKCLSDAAGSIRPHDICNAMRLYCETLSKRLKQEEEELLPMVRRQFSVEAWFALAAQFLYENEEAGGRRRHKLVHSNPVPVSASFVPELA